MLKGRRKWADLDSRNERVVDQAWQTRQGQDPGQGSPAKLVKPHVAAGRGRHRRSTAAAAGAVVAVAAGAAALAIPASASAGPAQPATPAAWHIVKATQASHGPNFTAITAASKGNGWAFESFQTSSARPVAWHLFGSLWQTARASG